MSSSSRKAAFTLVELLVVLGIMLIATTILFTGGGGGGDGVKLSSSQRIVSGIAQGARGQALLKNSEARLIIYADTASNAGGDPEKILRYFGIIYGDPESRDASGNYSRWYATSKGTYLPEGIYFDPDLSENNNWPKDTMNLEYPRQSAMSEEGDSPEFYYYKFNPNGTMASGYENSWLVIRAGTLQPASSVAGDDDEPPPLEIDFPEEGEDKFQIKSALIFRRVGTTTMVTDPEDID
jgi:prepilin-type N-terminal cleavage/methylation domain-containing protein